MVIKHKSQAQKKHIYDINQGVLSVKVRYAIKRGNRWHLQLPVPKDLRKHYNVALIKRSLGTDSVFEAAKAVTHLCAAYTSEFDELRAGRICQPRISDGSIDKLLRFIASIESSQNIESYMGSLVNPTSTELTVHSHVPSAHDPIVTDDYRLSDLTDVYR